MRHFAEYKRRGKNEALFTIGDSAIILRREIIRVFVDFNHEWTNNKTVPLVQQVMPRNPTDSGLWFRPSR